MAIPPADEALHGSRLPSAPAPYSLLTHTEAADLLIEQRGSWPLRPIATVLVEGQVRYAAVPYSELGPAQILEELLHGDPLLIGLDEARRIADGWCFSNGDPAVLPVPISGDQFVCRFITPWVDVAHFLAFAAWMDREDELLQERATREPRFLA